MRRRLVASFLWAIVAFAGLPATGAAAVRVAVIGDYGEDSPSELAVANLVHGLTPDIVLTVGDNNYDGNPIDDNVGKYYARYIGNYSGDYPPGSPNNRFFPCLGNHDYSDGGGLPEYLEYFTLPGAGVQSTNTSGNERYYDVVHGPIHFFILNSNGQEPNGNDSMSVQAQWLRAGLAASTAPWKIVLMHHAPYSSGDSHGSIEVMQWPYRAWGAHAVIAGHDHVYERFVFDGFPYFVNGIGGRSLRAFGTIQPGSVVRYSANYGAMLLTADSSRLTFETISVNPSDPLVDTFTLQREGGLPDLAVSPPGIAFGNVYLGQASLRTLVVHNAGSGDLLVGGVAVMGANGGEFEARAATGAAPKRLPSLSTASTTTFLLGAGDSILVVVRFEPTSVGSKNAFLRVLSNDPDEGNVDFPLSGTASISPVPVPDVDATPRVLDLGAIPALTQSSGSVRVHNRGNASLHGTIGLSGTDASQFAITAGGGAFTLAPAESLTVSLRFAPTTAGAKVAKLHITSDDPDESSFDVALTGDGLAPLEPHIDVFPDSLAFGIVVILTTVTNSLLVHNPGTGTLQVSSVSLVGTNATEFSIQSGGGAFTLSPGASRTITLRFSPVTVGGKTASLRFTSNDPDQSTTLVPLTGFGRPPPEADIVLGTTSLDFGGLLAGSGTATHTLVVRNTGEIVLSVSATSLVGTASADFALLAGGAPFAVDPGDSAVVQLRFAPATAGTKSAALRLQSNDPQQGTLDVTLTGIGIVSSATRMAVVFQESVDGASTNSITVATSRSVAAVNDATYLAAVTCRDPIAVTSITGMGLTWTRLRAQCGGRQQTMVELWAATGTPTAGIVVARFTGTPSSAVIIVTRYGGAAPSPFETLISGNTNGLHGGCTGGTDGTSYSLPFTTTAAGSLVFTAVALRNRDLTPGTGTTLRDDGRAGSGGWVSGLVTMDRTVATPTTMNVNGTFNQSVDWSLVAIEIVPSVVYPEIAVTPVAFDFGNVTLGLYATTSFDIRNDGAANLQVPGVSVQGANAAEFAITAGGTVPVLGPGANHTVTVRFTPAVASMRSALLRIVSDDPNEITLDLPLGGTGVAAIPDIAVTPVVLGFGSIPAQTSTSRTLQVSNQGNVALQVTQVRLTGVDSLAFSWSGSSVPFAVGAGSSVTLNVTFAPATQGDKNAVLRLLSNDPDSGALDVPLAGTALAALAADIAVSADTLDFGTIAVLTNASETLYVRNTGTSSLNVNVPQLLGTDAALFTLANASAFTLAPGDSTTLALTFSPTSVGTKNARLRLPSNDPDEGALEIVLRGNAILPPEGHVVFEGSASGGAASKTSVSTTTTLSPAAGELVLAAVASKSYVNVTGVSGLGLTWTLVRAQCGGRSQTGVQVWMGSGTPSPGVVTATLSSAPAAAVIVVGRYSGVDPVTPLGTIRSANTLGAGGVCSGGTDTAAFAMSLQTTVNDAMVFGAVAMRSRVLTPGGGYTQRAQLYAGPDGSIAGLAVVDQAFDVPGTVNVNGTFDGSVDWAVVGVEIRPHVGAAKQAAMPETVTEAGLVVGHGIAGADRFVELAAPHPVLARVRLLDVRGRSLRILFDGLLPAGRTRLPWGSTDDARALPSGVYFVHAEIGTQRFVRKALLLH